MRLHELKTQALRYVVLGDAGRALAIYGHLLQAVPTDLEVRMKIADVLVSANMHDLARRVYAALLFYDLALGRPLHAVVCAQALSALGESTAQLFQPIAKRYAADSPQLGKGARLSPQDPNEDAGAPTLPEGAPMSGAALRSYAEQVTELAASTTAFGELPDRFPPVTLLSELPSDAFTRLLEHAIVRRVPVGTQLLRQGEPGSSLFLIASGQARVWVRNAAAQTDQELARLAEGAIFGELALVSAQPRAATVEAVTEVAVLELGVPALRALAGELPRLAEVLERFTRDRLLKNLLATSPLFRPFSQQQRLDLARRFTGHEIAPTTDVIREGDAGRGLYVVLAGELEVVKGAEPFQTSVAVLRTGDLFGEIALVRGTPATATVRAVTPSVVLFLSREYFEKLTAALPELRAFFEELSDERLKSLHKTVPDDTLELVNEDLFLV
jgi:CRP-like cAMP-binding protein